ncbi:hypothetical protein O3P69_016157 [Scylla paramamosain]
MSVLGRPQWVSSEEEDLCSLSGLLLGEIALLEGSREQVEESLGDLLNSGARAVPHRGLCNVWQRLQESTLGFVSTVTTTLFIRLLVKDSTDRLGDTQCQCHRTGSEAQEEEEEHSRDISWPAVHSGVDGRSQ